MGGIFSRFLKSFDSFWLFQSSFWLFLTILWQFLIVFDCFSDSFLLFLTVFEHFWPLFDLFLTVCPYRNLWGALSCTPFVVWVEAAVEVVRIAWYYYLNLILLAAFSAHEPISGFVRYDFRMTLRIAIAIPELAAGPSKASSSHEPIHMVAIAQCQLRKCQCSVHSAEKHL